MAKTGRIWSSLFNSSDSCSQEPNGISRPAKPTQTSSCRSSRHSWKYFSQFMDKEVEAWDGEVNPPRSHTWEVTSKRHDFQIHGLIPKATHCLLPQPLGRPQRSPRPGLLLLVQFLVHLTSSRGQWACQGKTDISLSFALSPSGQQSARYTVQ